MGYGMDGEDWAGHMAQDDFKAEHICRIHEDRRSRLKMLKGKYVITCKGIKSGKKYYLQDRNISKKGWWTQYLSNAFGYTSKAGAEKKCNELKHNNCRIELIT